MAANSKWLGTPHDSAAFVKLETQTASNDASLDFTGFVDTAKYSSYMLVLDSLAASSDGGQLRGRVSTDGGSTWDSTASGYVRQYFYTYSTTRGSAYTTGENSMVLAVSLGNVGTGELGYDGTIMLNGFGENTHARAHTDLKGRSTDNHPYHSWYNSSRIADQINNAFQIYMDSGSISSGTVTLFGIPK